MAKENKEKIAEISARIVCIIDCCATTANNFSKILGYNRAQTVYDIINCKSAPSFDFFNRFTHSEYSEIINLRWLLNGEGEMWTDFMRRLTHEDQIEVVNKVNHGISVSHYQELQNIIPASSTGVGIPLLPIDAWAGLFKGEQTVTLAECDHFIVPAFKNADFLIPVRGDSMVPRYYSGDLVACKHLPLSDIFFQWGKVYVLDTNQGALIKEVRQGSSAHTIKLVSENPKYEPFEIPRECIYNIAIVQGLIRSE